MCWGSMLFLPSCKTYVENWVLIHALQEKGSLAKWLSFPLRTEWLLVWVPLQSLKKGIVVQVSLLHALCHELCFASKFVTTTTNFISQISGVSKKYIFVSEHFARENTTLSEKGLYVHNNFLFWNISVFPEIFL